MIVNTWQLLLSTPHSSTCIFQARPATFRCSRSCRPAVIFTAISYTAHNPILVFIFSWVAKIMIFPSPGLEIMKFPSPGLVVIGGVALGAIYDIFSEYGCTPSSKIQTSGQYRYCHFNYLLVFWLLAGPVFRNRGTVSRTQTGHSNTFILLRYNSLPCGT